MGLSVKVESEIFSTDGPPSPYARARQACPEFRSPHLRVPRDNVHIDAAMYSLSNFLTGVYGSTHVTENLSKAEKLGLKSLKERADELHISVSDKGGDFVVCQRDVYKTMTERHIHDNPHSYEYIPPTRHSLGTDKPPVPIKNPTPFSFSAQINRVRDSIQAECNGTWRFICELRHFSEPHSRMFQVHNSSLPVMYTLIKTHKLPQELTNISPSEIKVRPIVSCCGSPTEPLATLAARIVAPLLKTLPSNLSGIHDHLQHLRKLTPDELQGYQFYTADVSALFTNVNPQGCIADVINLAQDHWDEVDSFGLHLSDLQLILETVFNNAYFTFNRQVYKQKFGVFMGCSVSPPAAVIRLAAIEKASIYTDSHFISLGFYKRYVDDACCFARSREEAEARCALISSHDADGRIVWEVDFPTKPGEFVPFLDTEVSVTAEGMLISRYYRKPTNKGITLNYRSHHQEATKEAVVNNYLRTAVETSSTADQLQHSREIVKNLLRKNGYPQLHADSEPPKTVGKKSKSKGKDNIILTLPYTKESDCRLIRHHINQKHLPITPVFKPGRTLRDMLTSSRPLDRVGCLQSNPSLCRLCPLIRKGNCSMQGVIYNIQCEKCPGTGGQYIGETCRPLHDRFGEHLQAARNPNSHPDNAMAQHYLAKHPGQTPNLTLTVLGVERKTVRRKALEAVLITSHSPSLNNKPELTMTVTHTCPPPRTAY